MRATVTLDDEKFERVVEMLNLEGRSKSEVLNRVMEVYIQWEASKRLARLGGTQPDLKPIPRRRPPYFVNEDPE